MPYQNDMSTLAQIVSPAYAAQQAGMQNDLANESSALANAKSAALLPYAPMQAAANVGSTQANTELTNQQATGAGLKNLFTAQTMPGDVGATNAGNQQKMTASQFSNIQTVAQGMGQVAGMLDNVPPPARPAALQQILHSMGIDPQKIPEPLLSGDPDVLRQVSSSMIQQSSGFQTEMAVQGKKNEGSLAVAQTGADARVSAAEASANARIQAANIARQMHEQQQTFEQAAVRLQATNPQLAQPS